MANNNDVILTTEQETQLRQPIEDYVGKIQAEIDGLRADGTQKVLSLQSHIERVKRDAALTKEEKTKIIAEDRTELEKAKAVEAKNKDEISKLIADAENYIKQHFNHDYYEYVRKSCEQEKIVAREKYRQKTAELEKEHQATISKLSDHQEIKDEKYVYKNRLFDAKMQLEKELQQIKDRKHAAYAYKYHLIDLLRMSKFTFMETRAQKWENYKYTFNRRAFLLQNGLYIAIILIFIMLCIITPIVKNVGFRQG